MNNASYEGVQTKFNLVLKDVPNFTCLKHLRKDTDTVKDKIHRLKYFLQGTIHMNSESISKIHSSYMDSVNGTFSKTPMVEMVIPSMLDPTLTPDTSNHLVAQLFVMYSPNTLKDGTWDAEN